MAAEIRHHEAQSVTVFDPLPPPVPPALPPPAVPAPAEPAPLLPVLQLPNEQKPPAEHAVHVLPLLPHALDSLPVRHMPEVSQQPVHVSALQRWAVEPQPASTRPRSINQVESRSIHAAYNGVPRRQSHSNSGLFAPAHASTSRWDARVIAV